MIDDGQPMSGVDGTLRVPDRCCLRKDTRPSGLGLAGIDRTPVNDRRSTGAQDARSVAVSAVESRRVS
jgi:hypothetical protein